jgi:hypothetical protein
LAANIRTRAAALVGVDEQVAAQITAATAGLTGISFGQISPLPGNSKKDPTIQAVDNRTFKESPNPAPDPPPGGWSNDPLMRAAQKIAYGHASASMVSKISRA